MQTVFKNLIVLFSFLFALLLLGSCSSDVQDETGGDKQNPTSLPGPGPASVGKGTDEFTLRLDVSAVDIFEGRNQIGIPVNVTRTDNHQSDIILTTSYLDNNNTNPRSQFSDTLLSVDEFSSSLLIDLAIGPKPIQPQSRRLQVSAADPNGEISTTELVLRIIPTSAPDLYLLIGQSNMVGISELGAKQSSPGQLDEPLADVLQLNVTFNDVDNFSTADDFISIEKLYNTGNPLTIALDPLHSGLQGDGLKDGTRIGLGLSFAKRAKPDTTSVVYLIPAAWSDTGFCKRDTNTLTGIGWNATQKNNPALSGTLLHDRAIARTNAAIALTNGVLRGILWHQGEADSDDEACAQTYAENLSEMVSSLRSRIAPDARGPTARGPDADIPFIVGTMAKGSGQEPFNNTKQMVDNAHRGVSSSIPYADFANNDDLTPPAYACGGGSCIHFGADALREMGVRYYERLISVLPQ